MIKFKQNEDMLKLVKGKRITLVGPSPHLVGKNMGQLLNSYDTICRVNDYFPINAEKSSRFSVGNVRLDV